MQKFARPADRTRFAVCHAVLRVLLGGYLGASPSALSFERNAYGKPRLLPAVPASLQFNLSHTTGIGLLAVSNDLALGVDVEEIRPVEHDIAERYFSVREQADLKRLTGSDWLEGFFHCWTRKEAILKAEGVGLSGKLDAFDVSLEPNAKAVLLGVRPAAGFTAGLAASGPSTGSGFHSCTGNELGSFSDLLLPLQPLTNLAGLLTLLSCGRRIGKPRSLYPWTVSRGHKTPTQ